MRSPNTRSLGCTCVQLASTQSARRKHAEERQNCPWQSPTIGKVRLLSIRPNSYTCGMHSTTPSPDILRNPFQDQEKTQRHGNGRAAHGQCIWRAGAGKTPGLQLGFPTILNSTNILRNPKILIQSNVAKLGVQLNSHILEHNDTFECDTQCKVNWPRSLPGCRTVTQYLPVWFPCSLRCWYF